MKNILILLLIFIQISIKAQYPPNNSLYQLVFADEFNYSNIVKVDSLSKRWHSIWPWNQSSLQYTCDFNGDHKPDLLPIDQIAYITLNFENCTLNNGILSITSKKENYNGKVWNRWVSNLPVDTFVNFIYTTGMLLSKYEFQYGYYEVRCKLPLPTRVNSIQGLGPNFWMYGANSSCNWSEIDVFEFAGETTNIINYHTSNIHYQKKVQRIV